MSGYRCASVPAAPASSRWMYVSGRARGLAIAEFPPRMRARHASTESSGSFVVRASAASCRRARSSVISMRSRHATRSCLGDGDAYTYAGFAPTMPSPLGRRNRRRLLALHCRTGAATGCTRPARPNRSCDIRGITVPPQVRVGSSSASRRNLRPHFRRPRGRWSWRGPSDRGLRGDRLHFAHAAKVLALLHGPERAGPLSIPSTAEPETSPKRLRGSRRAPR